MSKKYPTSRRVSHSVTRFIDTAKSISIQTDQANGRLVFAMDATASRSSTWDAAMSIQAEMFSEASTLGGLLIQLVYYRGLAECRSSGWISDAGELGQLMSKVSFLAGRTQIERVLKHTLNETGKNKVDALVFIGDSMEEDIDLLADVAGKMGILGVPAFIFHEGGLEPTATSFRHIAKVSGGAYSLFDSASPIALRSLLRAVAAYAAGGVRALEQYEDKHPESLFHLTDQMKNR